MNKGISGEEPVPPVINTTINRLRCQLFFTKHDVTYHANVTGKAITSANAMWYVVPTSNPKMRAIKAAE